MCYLCSRFYTKSSAPLRFFQREHLQLCHAPTCFPWPHPDRLRLLYERTLGPKTDEALAKIFGLKCVNFNGVFGAALIMDKLLLQQYQIRLYLGQQNFLIFTHSKSTVTHFASILLYMLPLIVIFCCCLIANRVISSCPKLFVLAVTLHFI